MKLLKNNLFWRFLIPSLIGLFLFVTPINQDGNLTIPIAVISGLMKGWLESWMMTMLWLIISLSALVTIVHKIVKIPFIRNSEKLNGLFDPNWFWFAGFLWRTSDQVYASFVQFARSQRPELRSILAG